MTNQSKPGWLLWVLGVFAFLFFAVALAFYYWKFNISPMFCNYSTWEDFINNSHKNSFILDNFLAKLSNDPATWGTFGDYLGGTLNPIISFLALIGLLYTIHQQAQEMQATRKELKQAAKQQRKQVKQQSRQSEIFNLQQFESTFFSLLEHHNKVIENLVESKIPDLTNVTIDEKFNIDSYIKDNIRQNPSLKQYFIILFQILKFISLSLSKDIKGKTDNKITINDFSHDNEQSREKLSNLYINPQEKIYSDILRSFIPNDIFILLIFNCLHLNQEDKGIVSSIFYNFQGLINRYNFLEYLNLPIPIIHDYGDIIQNNNDVIWVFNAINPIGNLKKSFGDNNLFYDIKKLQDIKYIAIKIINDGISILNQEIGEIPEPAKDYNRGAEQLKAESEKQKKLIQFKIKKLDNIKKFLENKENNLS
ncbi:hypothetical protein HMPREF3136_10285 [Neisseria sp. HMSC15C08]|uniref:putative phage abortive infection protein n=1 Tax=Neisseria mucosa TaxID=488 RepID=UPI0008A34E2D|nr:putative phage abortive infection protein [Neisseria mucosa]OFV30262.1 hypothetical protein HMPREF3136_10285 [Neisseria sp. HMSC15C08]